MSKSDKEAMSRSERKKQNKKKKTKKKTGLGKKILLGIVGFLLAIGIGGLGLFTYYASSAPKLTEEDLTGTFSSDLVDMNGDVFYSLGAEERNYATSDEYPEVMLNAMKAIEDKRFDKHKGVDPVGIGRAALGYLTNKGEIVGGGSTITQQLVKLSVFTTPTAEAAQTLERKAQEAWLATQVERQLSKEQIITLYLNKVHMGGNVYGVATAAEEYYGKHVGDLELHEAAMLAAMPNAPNYYNPYNNPDVATNRRNLVLNEMVDDKAITQEEAEAAKEVPVEEGLLEQKPDKDNLVFDSYLTAVIDEVREKTEYDPYTAGLTIHTNYNPETQELLYDVVNSEDYVDFPNDELQTAVTLIDSTTGKIPALIGGRKSEGQLSTNRATSLQRSVGSTIKPLTVYGPAIEYEKFSTYHQVVDDAYEVSDWKPRNYDREFHGQMSIRDALVDSRNVPAAKIFNEDLNQEDVAEFLGNMGIDAESISPGTDTLVPSSAINGTMTPLELTSAFSTFANEGNHIESHTVNEIVTQDGEEIDLTPTSNKAMEDYTAYMVTDMLKGVIPYYGSQLEIPGYTQAAKTGTTNYTAEQIEEANIPSGGVPDNWVVGYSPYYTMGVWVGYDHPLEDGNYLNSEDGSISLSRDIYRTAMSELVAGLESRDWERPSSVVEESIADGSNPAELASPSSSNAVKELFVKGTEPSEVAKPDVDLSAPTGLSAEYDADNDEVNITWDSYSVPDDMDGDVEYLLSIGGEEQTLSDTSYTIEDPPRETIEITLVARIDDETSPSASTRIIVPDPNEDEEEEEDDEEDETDEPDEDEEEDSEESEDSDNSEDTNDSNNENNENNDSDSGNDSGDEDSGSSPPEEDEDEDESEEEEDNSSDEEQQNNEDEDDAA